MSIYLLLAVGLTLGAVEEYINRKTNKLLFVVFFVALTFLLAFRYGQGTDYFLYENIYNIISKQKLSVAIKSAYFQVEIGWRILNWMCSRLGMNFEVFILILSTVQMYFLWRFVRQYCPLKMVALLLAYPTLYLTYMRSAIRQSIVICLFLGVLIEKLLQKKYFSYVIGCFILSSIHNMAFILIIIPIIVNEKAISINKIVSCSLIAIILGGLNYFSFFHNLLLTVMPRLAYYIKETKISWFALMERCFTTILVLYATLFYLNKKKEDNETKKILQIYMFGFYLYLVLMPYSIAASRLIYAFKCLEICLLSKVLLHDKKTSSLVIFYVIFLCILMYIKNINSYIELGPYINGINVFNYPYVSIYNKQKIFQYRIVH